MSSQSESLVRRGIRKVSPSEASRHNESGDLDDEDSLSAPQEDSNDKDSPESEGPESLANLDESYRHKHPSVGTSRSRSPAKSKKSSSSGSARESSKPRVAHRPDKSSKELDFSKLVAVPIIVVLVLLAVCSWKSMRQTVPTQDRSSRLDILRQHLRRLKQSYPEQPEHNWQIIHSSVVEVLNGSDTQHGPAVLLMLASSHNENLTTRLADEVAHALSYAFQDGGAYGEINLDTLTYTEDVIAARHVIDRSCKSTFLEKQQHVMLAPHIESWHPDLAMMLHPLCDYENPWYKNAAIVLTAFTSDVIGHKARREYDRVAEEVLNKAWETMDTNQRHAIVSRVTVNVIVLRDEAKVCSKINEQ